MNSKVDKLYDKINNDKKSIIVFGLTYCIYCKKTLELLKKNKISYKYYSIDKYFNVFFNVLSIVSKLYPNFQIDSKHKTVPVIFYKKKFVNLVRNLE